MSTDPYSRLVAVLRVALPLVALSILSTLFLLSDRIEPSQSIPFADSDIVERIRGQQVTGPLFTGVTSNGDRIRFTAEELVTVDTEGTKAANPSAELDFAGGGRMTLRADSGQVDIAQDRATLSGDVQIESTTGYDMRSDAVVSHLSQLWLESPGTVRATSTAGTLLSGSMRVSTHEDGVQILFNNGVKLVYAPGKAEQSP
jgi:lipopolysaccharide export system protein LptC